LTDQDQDTERDIKKMARLENELKRLISAVDDRLSLLPPDRPHAPVGNKPKFFGISPNDWDLNQIAAVAGIAVLLVAAGWAGSSLFYTSRLKAQIEDELRPYAMELAETVTTVQTDLAPRLAAADELKIAIDQARRDVIARDEEIETTIVTAQSQLLGIRDSAIDDIERRLTDQTDDLTSMLDMLRERAVKLDQGLNEVSQALAAFDHQLPVLTGGFGEVAAQLVESRDILDQVSKDAEKLDGLAPPLLVSIAEHQANLEVGTKTLAILQTQLAALKTQTARSSRQLEQVLAQGRGQITSWQDMDRQVDHRKQEIMRNLDLYAESLNSHVREFLEVLNDDTVFNGG
jgi:chromosome segregation ATPase